MAQALDKNKPLWVSFIIRSLEQRQASYRENGLNAKKEPAANVSCDITKERFSWECWCEGRTYAGPACSPVLWDKLLPRIKSKSWFLSLNESPGEDFKGQVSERKWKKWSSRLSSSGQMQKINRGQTMWPLRQRAAREIKEERGALRGRRPAEPPSDLWRIQTGTKKPAVESRRRAEQNRESGSGMTTHWPPCLLSFSWSGLKETPLHSRTDPPACSACLSCSGGETGREVTGNIKKNHSAAWLTVPTNCNVSVAAG